jgi:hypothetical protein
MDKFTNEFIDKEILFPNCDKRNFLIAKRYFLSVEYIQELLTAIQRRNNMFDKLVDALEEMVHDETTVNGDKATYCMFCKQELWEESPTIEEHTDNCRWRKSQELLKEVRCENNED